MSAVDSSDEAPPAQDAGSTYVLRDIIHNVPLTTSEESDGEPYITCVDTWNGNLYIGTSDGEVLHYVSIPAEPTDESGQPTYIPATNIRPQYKQRQEGSDAGIKQILILPNAGKVCVICHGTLNFYTLPELSPAFGNIHLNNCLWVGGLDLDRNTDGAAANRGTVVAICQRSNIRLIRIHEGDNAHRNPTNVRIIELGNVSAIQRRGDLACVADGQTYSLLDVVNQQKNDLFPISSLTQSEPEIALAPPELVSASRSPTRQARSHERNESLTSQRLSQENDRGSLFPPRSTSRQDALPAKTTSRESSPAHGGAASDRSTSQTRNSSSTEAELPSIETLQPNIASPTPGEFLLTTGTKIGEPGVGLFVNLDGDPTRGTLEFSSYPETLVIDGVHRSDIADGEDVDEFGGFVLAIVRRKTTQGLQRAIEVQRWDMDDSDQQYTREWIPLGSENDETDSKPCGLRIAASAGELSIPSVSLNLRLRRFRRGSQGAEPDETEAKRNKEEDELVSKFARIETNVIFYSRRRVSWVARNALITELERRIATATIETNGKDLRVDASGVQHVINSMSGREPRNELEFLTLNYIRQKASLLLFGHLLLTKPSANAALTVTQRRNVEEALLSGGVDPRVILSLIPLLADEIVQSGQGFWTYQGLCSTAETIRNSLASTRAMPDSVDSYCTGTLAVLKRYLIAWRNKKGLASIADETYVFQSVDAALIHLLLLLDQDSPRGPAVSGSVRAELNEVVDKGVDCFDRAVELFEQFGRLYMLSRLYQSRKDVKNVLGTWKRILQGETDTGGEMIDGEHDLRRYLTKIRDARLVQEYGTWLAQRNTKLGVQVFADDSGRVKFSPAEALEILRQNAPAAVKDFLEHLVFVKRQMRYVNELIAFYLDTVLEALEDSKEARQGLLDSYETYRALHPPKPTYRHFMEDNSGELEWQRSRLQFLQLIGGAMSKYDIRAVRERLLNYSKELIPEMIILNGRESKHQEALHLLVHGLADYDTAIRYCLLGGSSIFHPGSNTSSDMPLPSREDQSKLFNYLLHEFFAIEDASEQLERTAELLERFGGWFDVAEVLHLIPDSWAVEVVSGFLEQALRRLLHERRDTEITMALASVQNLKRSVDVMEKLEAAKPIIVTETSAVEPT